MIYLGSNPVGIATSLPIFGDIVNIEVGEYTPIEDTLVSSVTFNHNLNTTPDFIYIYSEPIARTSETWQNEYLLQSNATNLTFTENVGNDYYTFCLLRTKINATSYNSTFSAALKSDFTTATSFKIILAGSLINTCYFKANTTYHYIIGKYKEVTPNA